MAMIVAAGDPAPGGGRFDFAQNPWINQAGDIAFGGHVRGEPCNSQGALPFCGESVYLRPAGKAIESIAHQGEYGPGNMRYLYAWGPLLNDRRELVYMGELMPVPGAREGRGIFWRGPAGSMPVALPEDPAPDGRTIAIVNPSRLITNYWLNNRGDIAFNAALRNGDSAFYVYSGGLLHLIAGTGTVIPGIGKVASVASFSIHGGVMNGRGQVLFWATMTDGRGVLLIATPGATGHGGKR
jgi:hypothetical protein